MEQSSKPLPTQETRAVKNKGAEMMLLHLLPSLLGLPVVAFRKAAHQSVELGTDLMITHPVETIRMVSCK